MVVLEARDRLGGRVWTNHSLGAAVELGAVWIHRATDNVLTELADSYGCKRHVTENKRLALYGTDGRRLADKLVTRAYAELTQTIMPEFLRRRELLHRLGRDMDMAKMMRSIRELTSARGAHRCALDFLLFRDIVQDHTAELRQTSAAQYDTDAYGGSGKDQLVPQGLDCLVHGLGRGLDVRLGRAVAAVRAPPGGGVRVRLSSGEELSGDRAVVTVPLGLLKDEAIALEPPPPRGLREAVRRLGWGEALKVALRFPRVFWPMDAHYLGKVGEGEHGCQARGEA